jgi:hypothetical protein
MVFAQAKAKQLNKSRIKQFPSLFFFFFEKKKEKEIVQTAAERYLIQPSIYV